MSSQAEMAQGGLEGLGESGAGVAGARYALNICTLRLQGLLFKERNRLLIDRL